MYLSDGSKIELDSWGGYESGKTYIAVGWLEGVPIPTGSTPVGFVCALLKLAGSHQAYRTRGYHFCTYCPEADEEVVVPNDQGEPLHLGSAEIWVPGVGEVVYCAPNLIIHYVRDHNYQPPADFINAVMRNANGDS